MRKTKRRFPIILTAVGLLLLVVGVFALFGGRIRENLRQAMLPLKYIDEIKESADRYGLDRCLVAAVVNTESGFRADAVSRVGAEGLMQVMPSSAEWIAGKRGIEYEDGTLFDPEINLDYGCWLLNYLLKRYDGNTRYALIAYNAGPGRLDEWLEEHGWELADGDIPYTETRNYVKRVLSLIESYGEYYGNELND